jgi:hypothetical protein
MNKLQLFLQRTGTLLAIALSTLTVVWCVQVGNAGAVSFFGEACKQGGSGSAACSSSNDNVISRTLARVTRLAMFLSGIVAVIMLTIGGFMYLTSNGDPSKAGEAKNTIVYTLIGTVVVGLSGSIILFVISRV